MRTDSWTAVMLGAACILCLATGPERLAAQKHTEFTPFVGMYMPMVDVLDERDVVAAGDRRVVRHNSTLVFGGRVGGTVSERVLFEAVFAYASGKGEVVYTDPSNVETRTEPGASVIFGSPRVLLTLGRAGGIVTPYFVFGATVLSHGGEVYDDLNITDGTTDVGGLIGLSGRVKVGPKLSLRVDAEDHFYNAKFGNTSGARSGTKWQYDIVVSLGVGIPF